MLTIWSNDLLHNMQISPTWTREKELQAQFIGLQQRYEERPETKSSEIIPYDLGMKLKLVLLSVLEASLRNCRDRRWKMFRCAVMLHGFMNLLSSRVTNSCAYILLHLFYRILYLWVCSPSFYQARYLLLLLKGLSV